MKKKILEVGYGSVNRVKIGDRLPLAFIGGPCAIESRDHAFKMAELIGEICQRVNIPWIYKSCYDKDCRSSSDSFHGLGVDHGLRILADVREEFGIPVVSDFSDPSSNPIIYASGNFELVPASFFDLSFNILVNSVVNCPNVFAFIVVDSFEV